MAPIYLGHATDALNQKQDLMIIVRYIVIYASCYFCAKGFNELQSLVYIKVQQTAYIELSLRTFEHLFHLPLDWHLKKKLGNTVRSVDRGITAADQMMRYVFLYLFPTIAESIAVMIVFTVHFNSYRLATYVFVMLVVYAFLTYRLTNWRKKFREAGTKHDNRVHELLSDSLINYEAVKVFTGEKYEYDRYGEAISDYQSAAVSTQFSLSALNCSQQLVVALCTVGGLILSARAVNEVKTPNPQKHAK